ncbi:hypothetical protein HPP92_012805 [Vanilla planifolia]|uniref:Uncharacterized protein n=1 Tax=Vanilla planifolia TaxID=51239 RepID=A0A835QR69_VANPL|nr:hypothetical protein HPP92_012805 [Vanilla planifolia]
MGPWRSLCGLILRNGLVCCCSAEDKAAACADYAAHLSRFKRTRLTEPAGSRLIREQAQASWAFKAFRHLKATTFELCGGGGSEPRRPCGGHLAATCSGAARLWRTSPGLLLLAT